MKLLFDENLSPRLVAAVSTEFPGSAHVHDVGIGAAVDQAVWDYALTHGLAIASKDSDFADLSVVRGAPPQVVWIKRGNCSTDEIAALLKAHAADIASLASPEAARLYVIE